MDGSVEVRTASDTELFGSLDEALDGAAILTRVDARGLVHRLPDRAGVAHRRAPITEQEGSEPSTLEMSFNLPGEGSPGGSPAWSIVMDPQRFLGTRPGTTRGRPREGGARRASPDDDRAKTSRRRPAPTDSPATRSTDSERPR